MEEDMPYIVGLKTAALMDDIVATIAGGPPGSGFSGPMPQCQLTTLTIRKHYSLIVLGYVMDAIS